MGSAKRSILDCCKSSKHKSGKSIWIIISSGYEVEVGFKAGYCERGASEGNGADILMSLGARDVCYTSLSPLVILLAI